MSEWFEWVIALALVAVTVDSITHHPETLLLWLLLMGLFGLHLHTLPDEDD